MGVAVTDNVSFREQANQWVDSQVSVIIEVIVVSVWVVDDVEAVYAKSISICTSSLVLR